MRRLLVLVSLLATLLASLGLAVPVAGAEAPVKAAVIVGPVGEELTPVYISLAEQAAGTAESRGATVARAYSPQATADNVLAAVEGASIVVYLGHAASIVAPGGLVMLVGEAGGSLAFGFDRPPVESWMTTTAWGTLDDLRAVVRLAERGRLRWDVETLPLDQAAQAHDRVRAGQFSGRTVLVPALS